MGPSDMAQTMAVFHEQGDQPWAECTEQAFKNTDPSPYFMHASLQQALNSWQMSAQSKIWAERLKVMATVKKNCLDDSHQYRKCYMDR